MLDYIIYEYIFIPVAHADELTRFLAKVNRQIINPLILVLFALAFVQFFWGLFAFLKAKQEEKDLTEGKQHLLWGIIGMVIMVSVFGIIQLLLGTIGVGDVTGNFRKSGGGNMGDVSALLK